MKVLHVLGSTQFTGAENVAADICMMFENEYEMAYCSPKGNIEKSLEYRGIKFIPLNKLSYLELKKVIAEYKPDLIHAHDIRATVIASMASQRIPVISHLHCNYEDMRRVNIKSVMYAIANIKTKCVISVSDSCLNEYKFRKFISRKTKQLSNIVYTQRIKKLSDIRDEKHKFDFVYLGRLCEAKNPERVARVVSIVLKKCPYATFGIIGDGDLKNVMQEVFQKEKVTDRVVFTGRLESPYKTLKEAKCLLMCSKFEGTPIAALEAMALGVPIVSTPVDGMINVVDNDVTGFLASDDEKLAESVQRLLEDNELYLEMSSNSITRFKQLSNESEYRNRLNDIYIKAINRI